MSTNLSLLAERFAEKFLPEPNTGCWLWCGAFVNRREYGKMVVDGKHIGAHRISWKLFCDEPLGDLHVLHRCDTPACVNPDHLFLGTQSDNNKDMFAKGRAYDRRGHRNSRSKLTPGQVASIRADQRNQYVIAKAYGVGQSTISRIQRGEVYVEEFEVA